MQTVHGVWYSVKRMNGICMWHLQASLNLHTLYALLVNMDAFSQFLFHMTVPSEKVL
jgi:hypothetical protein